jgi:hypothetical protein
MEVYRYAHIKTRDYTTIFRLPRPGGAHAYSLTSTRVRICVFVRGGAGGDDASNAHIEPRAYAKMFCSHRLACAPAYLYEGVQVGKRVKREYRTTCVRHDVSLTLTRVRTCGFM